MSVYSEREFAERAYRAGARGYLAKSSPPTEFLEAVRRILGGRAYVSPEYGELLVQGLGARRETEPGERLSDRELAMIRLIASGKSLTEIGRELRLSAKTISTYKTRAMEKLGLETNAALIAYALGRRLG
jgi:DNA-binding NarL/FixJ family response regulator